MFIALDEAKQRTSVEKATKLNSYFCPICGEPLIIRAENSLAVKKHFAHKRGTNCIDDWSHDMSEWHLSWQEKFPENCREVIIEKDGIKHRADVFINNTVIEFQHSPITSEEIAKRNNFYLSCGYKVVWVFDGEGQIKNTIGNSLDPCRCGENDLCWKREKEQFKKPFPQDVTVFLDYSTEISDPKFANQKVRILLWLKNVAPKDINFYRLELRSQFFYILHANFLKQFGAITDQNVPSISQIINYISYIRQSSQPKQQFQLKLSRPQPRSRHPRL